MPKSIPIRNEPLSCLFAINKPTGIISMNLLNKLQPIFKSSDLFSTKPKQQGGSQKKKWKVERIKLGQGGTLDPLADGVLVIGTNNATKQLAKFLDCTKEYRAIGIFGCSTDTYDSEGKRVNIMPFSHLTRESIESVLSQFRGEISQVPPIFSALKMDGKPLYEYARSGTPLPRPIAARKVTVSSLELINFTPGEGHEYTYPKATLGDAEKSALESLQRMINEGGTNVPAGVVEKKRDNIKVEEEMVIDEPIVVVEEQTIRPPTFEISMTVSSGTYVRSIIHDIGIALGSSAHVVKLTRTRQGEFSLNNEPVASTSASSSSAIATPSTSESVVKSEEGAATGEAVEAIKPVVVLVEDTKTSEVGGVVETTSEAQQTDDQVPIIAKVEEEIEKVIRGGCIEWEVFADAIKAHEAGVRAVDGERLPWEIELLHRCQEI